MSCDERENAMEDNTNFNAIACEQIPELFLDKIVAKKYFGKFGKIKRFILRPKRLTCIIEYENKEDAKSAYLNAGSFNGIDFFVSYAAHEVAHIQNTEEWVDPEVKAELEAMCPGNSQTILQPSSLQKLKDIGRMTKCTNVFSFPSKSIKTAAVNRQNSPQPEIVKIDSIIRDELEAILKTPAFTDEEKYRVLDARDKLIRLTTVRQTDIKKAVATKGTCPDMCPEKERLMREFQRQVSIFEMAEEDTKSTISHKKAIKEYSRSSADQEVPLSHELRSEPVLEMTMLYLVHRIVGLCDDPKISLCDWFHFLWDRTRSIRKDITQQELCSLGSVQLVEQCARFHIHCGARLVAEDPSVFDKKINAENLTKCLQTLKYMYHDLRIKGVFCPCEAEFRSYVILLNLGDSNFLWEVKQLPEFIQKSSEVKRAITFYNALQNNNFVRFFSMIKSPDTTYLSACILLGYFTKLRVRAMDAIIKSHNWRKNDVYLPLSYLTSILGFDDESSAVSFFNHYGLHCDVLDKRVLLDRLIKPNIEYAMDRALYVVESKRRVSVGECIYGKALPSAALFECHQPQSSFDIDGMLKIVPLVANDDSEESKSKAIVQHKGHQEQPNTNLMLNNNACLFKIPQTLSDISSKQQRAQQKLTTENTLNPFSIKKEERSSSPFAFKICDNILGEPVAINSINNPVSKSPSSNVCNIFMPNTETYSNTLGNVVAFVPASTETNSNILCTAVSETSNISYQKRNDNRKDSFENDNTVHKFQNSTNTPLLSSSENFVFIPKLKKEQITFGNEMENINIAAKDIKKNGKQFEEKDQPGILELKNFREHQNQCENNEREINKLKNCLKENTEQLTELFIFNVIEKEIFKLAQAEIVIWQTLIEASDLQKELLIAEVVSVFVEDLANKEYALMCYDQLLLSRYFNRWLLYITKKKEQRLLENIPLWITTDTRAQHAQAIKHPCQQENMQIIKRYRLGQPFDLNKFFKIECSSLFDENENPINLFALVGQHLLAKQTFTACGLLQQRKYFKFLITIPQNEEELLGFESVLNKWLMRLIVKCQTETGGSFVNGIEHNVALCVRKLHGVIPKNEQGSEMTTEGDHNDGVVCFITGIDIDTQSRKRLYHLLNLSKNLKRVPLAIIAYNCNCNKEDLAKLLGLDSLLEEGLIYSYLILGCQIRRKDFSFRELFINAVDFITNESYSLNSNEIQALVMQDVLPFLETSLGEEMWQRWWNSTEINQIFKKFCCLPEHVIGIVHKALDHLLHITQEDFDEMPEFPEELKEFVPKNACANVPLGLEFFHDNWKDKTEKNIVKSFLQSLYLPNVEKFVPDNIEDLKLWLLKYTSKCIQDNDLVCTKATHEAITNLVNQVNHLCLEKVELSSSIRMINYLPVFKPIVLAHINRMLEHFKKRLINLKVIYLKDDLKNYQTQPWWLNYEPLSLVTIDHSEISLSLPQTLQRSNKQHWVSSDEINKIIAKAEETSYKAEANISEYKRKKRISYRNSFVNLSSTSQLKRALDNSLYQFELYKKVGQYDTSFATELTRDIDESISKVLNKSPAQKRKISCLTQPNEHSDIDNVIAKATKILHNEKSKKNKKFSVY